MLRYHNIRRFQCFNDLKTFIKRNNRICLIRRDQFIRTYTYNKNISQTTGIIDHPQVIIVEHIKRSGGIYDRFIFKHNSCCNLKPQTYVNFSYQKKFEVKKRKLLRAYIRIIVLLGKIQLFIVASFIKILFTERIGCCFTIDQPILINIQSGIQSLAERLFRS